MKKRILIILLVLVVSSCDKKNEKSEPAVKLSENKLELNERKLEQLAKDSLPPVKESFLKDTLVLNPRYKFSKHSSFKKYWRDFKYAIKSNDKPAVLLMTNIPFEDRYGRVYDGAYGTSRSVNSNTPEEFLLNYDRIFDICDKKIIANAKFKTLNETMFDNYDTKGPGLYKLTEDAYLLDMTIEGDPEECHFEPYLLIFERIGGVFKLSYIPYQS